MQEKAKITGESHLRETRGRPKGSRIPSEDAQFIKDYICSSKAFRSMRKFCVDAFEASKQPAYANDDPPGRLVTVISAYTHALRRRRPLRPLYWSLLIRVGGISLENLPSERDFAAQRPKSEAGADGKGSSVGSSCAQRALEEGYFPKQLSQINLLWEFAESLASDDRERELVRYEHAKVASYTKQVELDEIKAEISGVYALKWLAGHPESLVQHRDRVLHRVIEWTLAEEIGWNIRYRAQVLAIVLAATYFTRKPYSWRDHAILVAVMDGVADKKTVIPAETSWWVIAVAIVFADDSFSNELVNATERWLKKLAAMELEHPCLILLETLRTMLVTILGLGIPDAVRKVAERARGLEPLVQSSYYGKLPQQNIEHQVRLLLRFANLAQCLKVVARFRPAKGSVDRTLEPTLEGTLGVDRSDVLKFISKDSDIYHAAKLIQKAATSPGQPWLDEGACLHDLEDWKPGGRFAEGDLKEALLTFYRVVIHKRDRCTKPGFEKWRAIMNAFGTVSFDPGIRALAEATQKRQYTF